RAVLIADPVRRAFEMDINPPLAHRAIAALQSHFGVRSGIRNSGGLSPATRTDDQQTDNEKQRRISSHSCLLVISSACRASRAPLPTIAIRRHLSTPSR